MAELESEHGFLWSAAAERSGDAALDCSRSIESLGLSDPKRRRRFALPAHSKNQARARAYRAPLAWLLLLFLCGLSSTFAGTLAQFRTPFGEIEVELYDDQKPVTVQNFKRLVQSGAYTNTFFHRLEPGFVIQGGGFSTSARTNTTLFAPPWSYVTYVPNFGSISNEFTIGPRLSNTNGTIAMAKTSDPNSANSQFFFNLANNSAALDNPNNSGGFTVFGHVVRDANNILGFFNTLSNYYGLIPMGQFFPTDAAATNLFKTLPVTYAGAYYPRYMDLVYVDISLLSVQVTQSNNLPRIAWNSVKGMTNVLEYTTVMPPAWKPLTNFPGDGNPAAYRDTTATNGPRFYRVRVY